MEVGECSSRMGAIDIANMMVGCFYSGDFTDAWRPERPYHCPGCHQTFVCGLLLCADARASFLDGSLYATLSTYEQWQRLTECTVCSE